MKLQQVASCSFRPTRKRIESGHRPPTTLNAPGAPMRVRTMCESHSWWPLSNPASIFAAILLSVLAQLARGDEFSFVATLNGPSQTPPNDSPGVGAAALTLDLDSLTMQVQVSFSGLLGTVTEAHVHCCTATPGSGISGVATHPPIF